MSKLILVPTPIGNLEDITLRAIRVLKEADLILAEDTRTSSHLLKHLGISKPMKSYHAHNEHKVLEEIVQGIEGGKMIALITDAGTPGISDPGFLIVRECLRHGITVETLPGPTAFIPALVNSGLPCDRFCFEGFLPQKKGRQTRIGNLVAEQRTMIFYESPYRLLKTLGQFCEAFGEERQACVSREISKLFEENFKGSLKECLDHFSTKTVKGEIVIVVAGCPEPAIKKNNRAKSENSPEEEKA
ncbi:MAG TPA: 16S rRNA (cytidine(1402)-2'-O)-methyltransferase [Bacteroidia bacterium]|nr:16S rRNA (cytidine(1402)-2'-O)-methyltransferase [Bacteroidia bacterium]HNS11425.1 16S rRNA (cytidine(1402)-2'-O)-methyltransferase [Bacteroidia bacterium]